MKQINIVIPMAGMGSRFVQEGYTKPKPFIDVNGKPMIVRVLDNLYYPLANYYLIAQKEHLINEKKLVEQIENEYKVTFLGIDRLTEGTACTVLYARKFINSDFPLLIANSDQIVDFEFAKFIEDCLERKLDGSILTFKDKELSSKWSFAKLDENRLVVQVKEKEVISEFATVGIYLFKKGSDFVNGAIDMIVQNNRVNNEFYTCPVYNYLIENNAKIGIYEIDSYDMHGLGTPEDLKHYLKKINADLHI